MRSVWSPPPSLVRRAMIAYLDCKILRPDLTAAKFVVYDFDTDKWWRWTRAGKHFRVVERVGRESVLGKLYSIPHDVLVLDNPLGFLSDLQ